MAKKFTDLDLLKLTPISHSSRARVRYIVTRTAATATHRVSALRAALVLPAPFGRGRLAISHEEKAVR